MSVLGNDGPRVIYPACPLCKSAECAVVRVADCTKHPAYHPSLGDTMRWKQCKACAHVFADGYFTPDALTLLASTAIPGQIVGVDLETARTRWAKLVEKIALYHNTDEDGRVWMDVGFGDGSLLFTAAEWGYNVVGLDLRAANVEAMTRIGIPAYRQELTDCEDFNRFDVISLANTLEHLPYPGETLAHAHRLLKMDGLLLLSTPNMDTIVWRLWDQHNINPYWGELEHYHNFTRKRLYELCAANGFVALHYSVNERYRSGMEVVFRRTNQ